MRDVKYGKYNKDDLILENVNLIYFVLKKMQLYEKADYFYDIGLIGLVKAANNYDASKKVAFSTVATVYIRNEILIDIRRTNALRNKTNIKTISLDAPINNVDGEELTVQDCIASDFNLEEYIIEREKRRLVRDAISELHPNEKKLLRVYFGPENMSQKQIAKILNISQANVSRRISKIIKKLQDKINYEGDLR